MIRICLVFLLACLAACSPQSPAGERVVLTVSGAVDKPNRGAVDPRSDVFLNWMGADFDAARVFTAAELAALPQETVETDYPAGGGTHSYSGPLLSAVLEAAGADGAVVTATALDGYAADIPRALIEEYPVILATARDGEPLALGGFGPAKIVFPRAGYAQLEGMDDSLWVWGVIWIDVKQS